MNADAWTNTTHDWGAIVDEPHVRRIREQPHAFAPGGAWHLLHEVLAYVADEANALGGAETRCDVALLPDGSCRVRDYGRGTDTRRDIQGRVMRKPVMATKHLRFFDDPSVQGLPDGHARRGMSVVAALSDWLVHENRRPDGAWRQRYERGLPADDLIELGPDGTTGTLVHFLPTREVAALKTATAQGCSQRGPCSRSPAGRLNGKGRWPGLRGPALAERVVPHLFGHDEELDRGRAGALHPP